jgi:excisionase family DNA binding protein
LRPVVQLLQHQYVYQYQIAEQCASHGIPTVFDEQFISKLADALASRIAAPIPAVKRLFTLAEAAEYIGRSPKAIEHLIQRGTIPVTKIDGKRQVDKAALDKIISDHTYFES